MLTFSKLSPLENVYAAVWRLEQTDGWQQIYSLTIHHRLHCLLRNISLHPHPLHSTLLSW